MSRLFLGFADALFEKLESPLGKDPHIGLAVWVAGLDGNNLFDRAGDGDAGVTVVVAVTVARGSAGPGLSEAPSGVSDRMVVRALSCA